MIDFWITLVIALLVAIGVINFIGYFLYRQESKNIKNWLDGIENELKKREREANKNGR